MVRFSCFNAHTPSHKPKKTVESSTEARHKTLQDPSLIRLPKTSLHDTSSNSLFVKMEADIQANDAKSVKTSLPAEQSWNFGEINGHLDKNRDDRGHQNGLLRKSQSLGSALCHEGNFLHHNDLEEETDQGFSSDSPDQNGLVGPNGSKDSAVSPTSQHQKDPQSDSVNVCSDLLNTESLFSIGDPQHSEKEGPENSDTVLSGEGANPSGNNTPHGSSTIVRSHSLPNIGPSVPTSGGCFHEYVIPQSRSTEDLHSGGCFHEYVIPHSRSSGDLHVLDKMKEIAVHEVERQVMPKQEIDKRKGKSKINDVENPMDNVCDSFNYSALAKYWIMPVTEESNLVKHLQGESSVQRCDEFESKDFKVKRIEEWVNDLQHFSPLEEANQLTETIDTMKRDSTALNVLTAAKMESKATPGMEAAKQYISSLGASATTAQLSNHGLTVIPFLSAFVSVKVVNLSGNSIARITAGALPRGLHVLNLSKNNISAIEGLRELTRLRVLDLSYNRIFRIGHGLASCSALKELYLAGNKISEVEGLHRLLKLTVLDLRFNKISTAKCLGQLAANYNSLQAISLEGNPAQKNVGDEQLKKYLQGLLPHLVYFNRQPIKTSTLKDAADRSVRLGIGGHQFERGLRSDNKAGRKAGHGVAGSRASSSHGLKNQATVSLKQPRGRVHLPASTKAPASNHYHHFDLGSKLLNFRSGLSIQRSQSEGTLGAL